MKTWVRSTEPTGLQLCSHKGSNLQKHSRSYNGLDAVNVARPGKYGNPHRVGMCEVCGVEHTAKEAVDEFEAELIDEHSLRILKKELKGRNLACWCKIGTPCHRDVLLKFANNEDAMRFFPGRGWKGKGRCVRQKDDGMACNNVLGEDEAMICFDCRVAAQQELEEMQGEQGQVAIRQS